MCATSKGTFWTSSRAKGIIFTEIGPAKGTIFEKVSLANSTSLNMLVAEPYPKFSQEPPPLADKTPDKTLLDALRQEREIKCWIHLLPGNVDHFWSCSKNTITFFY